MAKPCIHPGCAHVVRTGSRCPRHEHNTTQAGYGASHQRLRKAWADRVAGGRVHCARCGQLIRGGQPWDLDHRDDRSGYLGPSHRKCNRANHFGVASTSRFFDRTLGADSPCPRDDYTPPGGIA